MKDERAINDKFLSNITKDQVQKFEEADRKFKEKFEEFWDTHADELEKLDELREERNKCLNDARNNLREDAKHVPYQDCKKIHFHEFLVQKKWKSWFITDMFISICKNMNLYDSALAEGVIKVKTEVDTKLADEWIRKNSLEKALKPSEDGKELTPAIYGPKQVTEFGSEEK